MPHVTYAGGSIRKVCQLTGEYDRERNTFAFNRTESRFGLVATDLGSSFHHGGRFWFLFGDTWPDARREEPSTQSIRDVMTRGPVTVLADASLNAAARQMKEHDIGDVIVIDDNELCGVVTDRDIVVRALAEDRDQSTTKLADIWSRDLVTLAPTDSVEDAIRLHARARHPSTADRRERQAGRHAVDRRPGSGARP